MVRVYIDCVSKSNSPVNMITPRVWMGVCRCLMVKSSFGCYKDDDKLYFFLLFTYLDTTYPEFDVDRFSASRIGSH